MVSPDGQILGAPQPPEEFSWDESWKSIPARFESQARQFPERFAVADGSVRWTYGDLNRRANGLAHCILSNAGEQLAPVALLLDLEADMIAAIYGSLKARKFYVPLDPYLPYERLRHLLNETGAQAIVAGDSHAPLAATLARSDRTVVRMPAGPGTPDHDPGLPITPDDLAYVMYTSGSTGLPKGVMHTHRSVLLDMWRQARDLRTSAADCYGLLFAASSSASCCSVFGALLNGAGVSCFDLHRRSLLELAAWLTSDRISICDITVATLRLFAASIEDGTTFPGMRLIAPGGEPLYGSDVALCRRIFPNAIVQNSLGTTETRTATQYFIGPEVEVSDALAPIGYPVAGKRVMLLDESGKESSSEGEIAVRSRYLSPGYWNSPELTARAFLPTATEGEKTYLTGDLGKRLPDGCLVHLGRKDSQVKIRGYRVEVAEIENFLLGLPGVGDAAVSAEPDPAGTLRLVARIVTTRDYTARELRAACANSLPSYCVPSEFRRTKQLPTTANGKLARRSLSGIGGELLVDPDFTPIPPSNKEEQALCELFAAVLGRPEWGVDENFFEHGGDSIRALDCLIRIEKQFGMRVPPDRFFEAATVRQVAVLLVEAAITDAPGFVPLRPVSTGPRLYFLHGYMGSVMQLRELSQGIDPRYMIYGIEPAGEPPAPDMIALGTTYARRLHAFQPTGEFRLAGYSFGGMLAYEVGRQLSLLGREVTFIGVIDSTPSGPMTGAARNPVCFAKNAFPWFADELRHMGVSGLATRLKHFMQQKRNGEGRSENSVRMEDFFECRFAPENLRETIEGYLTASIQYRPAPSQLRVTLFRARIRPLFHSLNPVKAWRQVTPALKIFSLEGNHLTILDPARNVALREALNTALEHSEG